MNVTITWEPSGDLDVVTYVLYKGDDGLNWFALDTVDAPDTYSEQTDLDDYRRYYFAITAIDDNGSESLRSTVFSHRSSHNFTVTG